MITETPNVAPQPIRRHRTVLIGESGHLIREALKCWIEHITSVDTVHLAATRDACLEIAQSVSPSLAILPLHLEYSSGIQTAADLKGICPTIKIAFWVDEIPDVPLSEILALDPIGLISTRDITERTAKTIENFLQGIATYPDHLDERLERIRRHLTNPGRKDILGLTMRQREVLRYLAQGHTVKEIASQMHLSAKSVDSHKYRLMKTLEIHDRVHLTRFAIREGLLEA